MRPANEEHRSKRAIDLVSAVTELHGLSSQELSKLIEDSEDNAIQWTSHNGSSKQIEAEVLAKCLGLHLIARLMSSERDEALLKYLLCGFRLLHTLYDIASRHTKLEQVLLVEEEVPGMLIELTMYMHIVLGVFPQENHASAHMALLHSVLVASSLYLLTLCISPQWHELAQVLSAHPKWEKFMIAVFAAVRLDIQFLQKQMSAQLTDSSSPAEETVNKLAEHCEASLQFLHSLCKDKSFQEKLIKNEELCRKGGILFLTCDIMKLDISPSYEKPFILAAVSRLKSKAINMLLHLCEAENVSYLDEVASDPRSFDVAKSIALKVLELLKTKFDGDTKELCASSEKTYPRGLLQLNAMRLADILSDDSNFRSYITIYFTEVLATIFSRPHGEFLSSWCSSDLSVWEEDATLDYDSFTAAGWVLEMVSSSEMTWSKFEPTFYPRHVPRASYAHQRTSLLVKVIANLHCFIPDLCKEEKDLFLNKFIQCLLKEHSKVTAEYSSICGAEKAAIISQNLRSLLNHAESLTPGFLIDDDVQLLRVFISQLEPLIIPPESRINRVQDGKLDESLSWERLSKMNISEQQDARSRGGCSSAIREKLSPVVYRRGGNLNEGLSENSACKEVNHVDQIDGEATEDHFKDKAKLLSAVETSGTDSSMKQKNSINQMEIIDLSDSCELAKENGDEKVDSFLSEDKQQRRKKRTVMNDKQVALMESALLEEPDIHRNAASLQSWATKLSLHGSEVTSSQLKNWLNNRKARLARAAAKDVRLPSGVDDVGPDKQSVSAIGPLYEPPKSPFESLFLSSTCQRANQSELGGSSLRNNTDENSKSIPYGYVQCEARQYVLLVNGLGEEIGKGYIFQSKGSWHGKKLEEAGLCVVDVNYLKVDRSSPLPYPSEGTGNSFGHAEILFGIKRVLWDSMYLVPLQTR